VPEVAAVVDIAAAAVVAVAANLIRSVCHCREAAAPRAASPAWRDPVAPPSHPVLPVVAEAVAAGPTSVESVNPVEGAN